MMLDAAPQIQHYPMPMKRFGMNPYGEPRYRIVLAPSVTQLVGGQWPDGSRGYRWSVPLSYRDKNWILESWDNCRMTQHEWDSMVEPFSGWPVRGPYPTRGEYYLSWEFERGLGIWVSDVERIIGAIEKGRGRSFQEIRQSMMQEYQQEEKDSQRAARDEVRDACTAFGVAPISSSRVSRGTKTAPELRSAQELGLPLPRTGPKLRRSTTSRRTFDVRDAQVTSTLFSGRR
jgi:hypothetical protein